MKRFQRKQKLLSRIKHEKGEFSDEEMAKLSVEVVNALVDSFVRSGAVDPTNKSPFEIAKECADQLHRQELSFGANYLQDLLDYARDFRDAEISELSILFYALWFEHWLNGLIKSMYDRKNLPFKEFKQLVRSTKVRDKSRWVLRLLELKPIHEPHAKLIDEVAEIRNAFVHYKWQAYLEDEKPPKKTAEFFARIEDKFAPAYLNATQEEREVIKRLAWYSTEFGIVLEENRPKVFGAGIISGRAELTNTIMEFYRLDRDDVLDDRHCLYDQICEHYQKNMADVDRIIAGVNRLHQAGEMSSQESGWNVVQELYKELGLSRKGYFGGDVLLAPFTVETIAKIPKTVYAFNPIFFVFRTFEELDEILDSYLLPIANRS